MATPDTSHAHASGTYTSGDMDIAEHKTTFSFVMGLTKWGSLAIASVLILLVFWFCTPAGFGTGFIVAVIVAALGGFVLSRKPKAGH